MIGARIDGDSLEIEITGRDWWPHCLRATRLQSRLQVRLPLEHITAARAQPRRTGLRYLNVPAGGKRDRHGTFVWCRRRAPVLELHMDGQPYRHVVVSVPDPEPLAVQIRRTAGVPEI
jgi:hypothetical protein